MQNNFKILIAFLLQVVSMGGYAQKIPNKQEANQWAPDNIKIDGKADEWDNKFQAHNNATNLYYTIANNDEFLYLIVQAKNPRVIEKILDVGVTLVIKSINAKNDKDDDVAITFPIIDWSYVHGILVNAGDKANWPGLPRYATTQSQVLTRTDTSVMWANKVLTEECKTIKIIGAKSITDTLVSVYNEQSISVAAQFSYNGAYTYELRLPLQYFGISINNVLKFNYRIILKDWGNSMVLGSYRLLGTKETLDSNPDINSTTDFSGEYTLAKKP